MPAVSSVDYPVIARGGQLVVAGTDLAGATSVSIGGQVHTNLVAVSSTSLTIAEVDDATPIGSAVPLVVSAPGGQSAPFEVSVVHLVVSEIEPDSPGVDAHEFAEVATGLPGPLSLSGYLLVFFNGSTGGGVIDVYDLGAGGAMTNDAGVLLVGSAALGPQIVLAAGIQSGEDAAAIYQFPAGPGAFPSDYPTQGNVGLIDAVIWESGSDADMPVLYPLMASSSKVFDEGATSAARETVTIQRCDPEAARRDADTFLRETPSPGVVNRPCGSPLALPACTIDFDAGCPTSHPGECGATFVPHGPGTCDDTGGLTCSSNDALHTLAADERIDVFLAGTVDELGLFLAPYLHSQVDVTFYALDGSELGQTSVTQDCNAGAPSPLSLNGLSGTRRIRITGAGDLFLDDFTVVNPGDPDSDGDGLTDGEEAFIYGTDPGDPDTDGDGFDDGEEVAAGSDPNDPESTPAVTIPVAGPMGAGALGLLLAAAARRRLRPSGSASAGA